jgi:hypothetical protein
MSLLDQVARETAVDRLSEEVAGRAADDTARQAEAIVNVRRC